MDVHKSTEAQQAIAFSLRQATTDRLKINIESIAKSSNGNEPISVMDQHTLVNIFKELNQRGETSSQEMLTLELKNFDVLENSEYGIPNIERVLTSYSKPYALAISIVYKRNDWAIPVEETYIRELSQHREVATLAYRLLKRLSRIPGTREGGEIDSGELVKWIFEVRELCQYSARAGIGDVMIGELLSKSMPDGSIALPPPAVCKALEKVSSKHIEEGFALSVKNSIGISCGNGGLIWQHGIATKLEKLAREIVGKYHVMNRILMDIAQRYNDDARRPVRVGY